MQDLTLTNRHNLRIVGTLETPTGAVRGTCIVQHAWGDHRNKPITQAIKDAFLESGFQTFNFDSTHSYGQSDGSFEYSTMQTYWEDFEDVALWAQNQNWFIAPLVVTGYSMGGYSAVRYAAEHPDQVALVVGIAPMISGELSFAARRQYKPGELERWEQTGVLERIGATGNIRVQHWSQMLERLNHDLLPMVHTITMPILCVVGSADTSVPPDHIQQLLDAIPGKNKHIKIIPGASHTFGTLEERKKCKEVIRDWLRLQH